MIIGINGKIGSGKDTVGKIIQYLVDFYTLQKDFPDAATDLPDNPNKEDFDEWLFNMGDSEENNAWEIKKFAGKLKQFASMLTGISVEDLEKEEVKNSYLSEEWILNYNEEECTHCGYPKDTNKLDLKPTVRNFLQVLGTEAIRNNIHENAWVNALMVDYKIEYINQATGKTVSIGNYEYYKNGLDTKAEIVTKEEPDWIITDMRFPNELKAVKDRNGISIRVKRYDLIFTTPNEHISETALDNVEFDYVIDNDSTIEELINKVKEILIKEKII
jgi:hypothetical protein